MKQIKRIIKRITFGTVVTTVAVVSSFCAWILIGCFLNN